MSEFTAVDVQGFAGGFSLGVVQAGGKIIAKNELPGGFGAGSMLANRHLVGDFDYHEGPWQEWPVHEGVDVVFGNPPCSGFSVLTSTASRGMESKINDCMWAIADYGRLAQPKILMFESVQQAFSQGRSLMQALRDRVEDGGSRYELFHIKHNGFNHGGPAIRARYMFVLAREDIDFGIRHEVPTRVPRLHDVIGDLVGAEPGSGEVTYPNGSTWWTKEQEIQRDDGMVDGHHVLDNPHAGRVRKLIERGFWEEGMTMREAMRRTYQEDGALPDDMFTPAQMEKYIESDFFNGFQDPKAWDWHKAARVATGWACGSIVHPIEMRLVTIREVFRLQGFPDTWMIDEMVSEHGMSRVLQWPGKGVPVQAGRWVAKQAANALRGDPGPAKGELIGEREHLVKHTHDYKMVYNTRTGETEDTRPKWLRKEMAERDRLAGNNG